MAFMLDRDCTEFNVFIMERRKELKLLLKDVAEYCGVSINFVSMMELGKKQPSDKVTLRLSEILDVEDSKLFSMIHRVSPVIIDSVNEMQEHEGLRQLFLEVNEKVSDKKLRDRLFDEVFNVYEDFLKRHNILLNEGEAE